MDSPAHRRVRKRRKLLAARGLGPARDEGRHAQADSLAVASLQQSNRSVPIVFANVSDPVGNAFVASLARPGGNTTGFMNVEFAFSAKWLELLKEIAPRVTRVAVVRNAANPVEVAQFHAVQ